MSAKHTPESVACEILGAAGTALRNYDIASSRARILEAAKPYADAMNERADMLAAGKAILAALDDLDIIAIGQDRVEALKAALAKAEGRS